MTIKNAADEIEEKAKAANVPLTKALDRAGIPYSTFTRWRKKNPKTFEIQAQIHKAIDDIESEQVCDKQ